MHVITCLPTGTYCLHEHFHDIPPPSPPSELAYVTCYMSSVWARLQCRYCNCNPSASPRSILAKPASSRRSATFEGIHTREGHDTLSMLLPPTKKKIKACDACSARKLKVSLHLKFLFPACTFPMLYGTNLSFAIQCSNRDSSPPVVTTCDNCARLGIFCVITQHSKQRRPRPGRYVHNCPANIMKTTRLKQSAAEL